MTAHKVQRNKIVRKEQKSVARKFTCCFYAPVVQWIEYLTTDQMMSVRFVLGVLFNTLIAQLD